MKNIFFLGGYDAEMCEIRNILESNKLAFFDKKLSWGAKASDYQKEIARLTNEIAVLIELTIDIPLPEKAIIVDHHSQRSGIGKPTSIEQVAEMLGIKLSRWQKLIAANDRGWIDGLQELGATEEEIKKIRFYDRQCQGVTQMEEEAAEEAVQKIEQVNHIAVVHFPFKHTSPVMDRLYGKYKNILVITPEAINFSGEGKYVQKLVENFPAGWYGGQLPEKGFWGMENRHTIELKTIIDNMKRILK